MREAIMEFIKMEFGSDDLTYASALLSDSSYAQRLARFVIEYLLNSEEGGEVENSKGVIPND